MQTTIRTAVASFLLLSAAASLRAASVDSPAIWANLDAGRYPVGFRILEEQDSTRAVRWTPTPEPRPIRLYVWYPALPEGESEPLRFGRYASLANDDIVLARAREKTAFSGRPLARSLGRERYEALLRSPVRAVEGAPGAEGRFPLIVLGQGLYYESPVAHAILAEYLAVQGFVVATCPLVGTDSPLVSLDVLDLETQVRDLEFVIGRSRRLPFVDPQRLGVLGFDMGGIAGVILTMRNPDVDAFVSLDAGILYDGPLEIPAASPHFDPSMLRVPWLHATQRAFGSPPPGYEGTSLWDTALFAERTLVLIEGVQHVDFTSYALIEDRDPVPGYWGPSGEDGPAAYVRLCRYLRAFFSTHLGGDDKSREHLADEERSIASTEGWTIEHRAAQEARPTYSDFLNEALAGDATRAVALARELRGTPSADHLLEPFFLSRLGAHLQLSWQLQSTGLRILELNTEFHPRSPEAWSSLAEAQAMSGDHESAVASLRKAVELDPTNESLKRFLAWLENR